jgi:hypothetical protein
MQFKNVPNFAIILLRPFKFVYIHGRPQTFFQGRAKIFQGWARTYFLPKKQRKKYYFSQKKSENILFLAGQGGKNPPCPPLRTPMSILKRLTCIMCRYFVFLVVRLTLRRWIFQITIEEFWSGFRFQLNK